MSSRPSHSSNSTPTASTRANSLTTVANKPSVEAYVKVKATTSSPAASSSTSQSRLAQPATSPSATVKVDVKVKTTLPNPSASTSSFGLSSPQVAVPSSVALKVDVKVKATSSAFPTSSASSSRSSSSAYSNAQAVSAWATAASTTVTLPAKPPPSQAPTKPQPHQQRCEQTSHGTVNTRVLSMHSSTYVQQTTTCLPPPVTARMSYAVQHSRASRSDDGGGVSCAELVKALCGLLLLLLPFIVLLGLVGAAVSHWAVICQVIEPLWQGFAAAIVAVFRGLCFLFTLAVLGLIIAEGGAPALGLLCCCMCIC